MRKTRLIMAVLMLALVSLSCNFLMGKGKSTPTEAPVQTDQGAAPEELAPPSTDEAPALDIPALDLPAVKTDFPLPDNSVNLMDLGNGSINFQVKMSAEDAIGFYRDSFGKLGYKEREINTAISDGTFSLVFDGHSSGKAIVLQGVDMGGTLNINIRLEDI